ncbi:MAG: crosslink repair DNA glycosylase YcaQ family protein [Chloroflexota bacterium]|nr:crosslink repair DNA glycosylase YcaQ family protein [Chloroflexota bacterium]
MAEPHALTRNVRDTRGASPATGYRWPESRTGDDMADARLCWRAMSEGGARLKLTRDQILGHRRRVSALDARLPAGSASLEAAASAGLQDSMPRAALLSLHARVTGVHSGSWEDPALIQIWGPRYSNYVVAARDRALFTIARYPDDVRTQRVAEDMAARLAEHIGEGRMRFDDATAVVEGNANRMRYATLTGTVAIRWDGARQAEVWIVPRPAMTPVDARRVLSRRYLHVFGPTTHASFSEWAGIGPAQGRATFDELAVRRELVEVTTPLGEASILASDETSFRTPPDQAAAARLLPSGDTYFLLQGRDRELLVPDAAQRALLWTTRVWPGALMVGGEVAGTWRRVQHKVTISVWRALSPAERTAVEVEALSLPLPRLVKPIAVAWHNESTHAA